MSLPLPTLRPLAALLAGIALVLMSFLVVPGDRKSVV